MAGFTLSQQPRYPVYTIDTDDPVTADQILHLLSDKDGVTFCIRSAEGHPQRGGYFFCVAKKQVNEEELYELETMEGVVVDLFSLNRLIAFMNHAVGLKFDKEMLIYCQNSVNFRDD